MKKRHTAAFSFVLLTLTGSAAAQAPIKVFTGFTLIDGSDRAPVANAVMVVQDGRINEAGPAGRVKGPPDSG